MLDCGRCSFLKNCTHQCMSLPEGKHCSDCESVKKCTLMFGAKKDNTHCGFEPSKFSEKMN